jgi:hypothetical protein
MTRRKRLLMLAGALLLAVSGGAACQPTYNGASNLSLSSSWGGSYDGPVEAVAGRTPAQGRAALADGIDDQTGPVVLVDFEHNGVRDGVWGLEDHDSYFSMVFMRERCTVVVLGWRASVPAGDPLITARTDIQAMAATRASLGYPTVVADLRPLIETHPEYLTTDGIHLSGPAAATAYANELRAAKDRCPA